MNVRVLVSAESESESSERETKMNNEEKKLTKKKYFFRSFNKTNVNQMLVALQCSQRD